MMTTYWDLSERERAELSREDVERYVDAELMLKGVLRVKPPVLAAEPEVPQPTKRFFSVTVRGQYNSRDHVGVVFETLEQARAFVALAPMCLESEWLEGSSVQFVSKAREPEIAEMAALTAEEKDAAKADLSQANAIHAANERAKSQYEENLRKQNDALKGLWSDWCECRDKRVNLQKIADTFDDYVRTVGGDVAIASKFLSKVFPKSDIEDAAAWFGKPIVVHFAEEAAE